jgi:hypothetical protein
MNAELRRYLRDAAVTFVPELAEDQFLRLGMFLADMHPHVLVSRLSYCTFLVKGIATQAATTEEADARVWELMSLEVRSVLSLAADARTRITSIDVQEASAVRGPLNS